MSSEPFRPRLHFSPATGWLNDPNGLIFVDGVWHVFYQHHPHSTLWGPMHWGHASSRDLVNWTHLPIALKPDTLGTCFSGSAVATPEGEIKLFYTAHQTALDGSDFQVQCLVHADHELTSFAGDERNPVVDNPGLSAFRDPKVFWHEPTRRWIMVVTHGQSIGIRSSSDLVNWALESEFGDRDGRHGNGPWECPDLFPLQAADGTTHWILLVGIGSDSYGGGSGTQYFIGDFDGHRFANGNSSDTVLWADYGRDYYAAQSFHGAPRPTTMAWASNWQYARETPTRSFRGVLSLPRELGIADTPSGMRLVQGVPPHLASTFDTLPPAGVPKTGTYHFRLEISEEPQVAVCLFGEAEPQFTLHRVVTGWHLRTVRRDKSRIGASFAHDYVLGISGSITHIDFYVDNGLVELRSSDGLVWLTSLYFPEDVAGAVRVEPTRTTIVNAQPRSGSSQVRMLQN
ncbi:MAG: glycoside hydrolase family 32 protein [Devosia sp.]|uniref:glycoside hydrolase family 32 protein n=1 Tax=Devosia sp. 66-22 TaxID=1895753 RepID=UPI0009287395|nr:glycoside hydrolase family 32 protein [Devosia sp. 66-22]MBN9347886.1 glycoside hydrolase family 32 protein [Devosia sp.]OJX50039.1 MAG: hypothetical protein BGO81_05125 [Devosia sp. 66-22]